MIQVQAKTTPEPLEQFQENCASVFRSKLRKTKEIEPFSDPMKRRTVLASPIIRSMVGALFATNNIGSSHGSL
jgi:hypothetical protein